MLIFETIFEKVSQLWLIFIFEPGLFSKRRLLSREYGSLKLWYADYQLTFHILWLNRADVWPSNGWNFRNVLDHKTSRFQSNSFQRLKYQFKGSQKSLKGNPRITTLLQSNTIRSHYQYPARFPETAKIRKKLPKPDTIFSEKVIP